MPEPESGKLERRESAHVFRAQMMMAWEYISQRVTPKRSKHKTEKDGHDGSYPYPSFSSRESE